MCTVGSELECEEVVRSAFEKLEGAQRRCFLLYDEMYVRPSLRYRGGYLLGFAVDDPSKVARTVLAIMVKPMMGGPSFIFRCLLSVTFTIHAAGGFVLGLIADNHPSNRKCYSFFRGDDNEYSWRAPHPVEKERQLYLLHDTVHRFKSLRNNWVTEKMQQLILEHGGVALTGRWKEICHVYVQDKDHIVKRTNLTSQACYPNNLDLVKGDVI